MNCYPASLLTLLVLVVAATSTSDFDNTDVVIPESDDVLVDVQQLNLPNQNNLANADENAAQGAVTKATTQKQKTKGPTKPIGQVIEHMAKAALKLHDADDEEDEEEFEEPNDGEAAKHKNDDAHENGDEEEDENEDEDEDGEMNEDEDAEEAEEEDLEMTGAATNQFNLRTGLVGKGVAALGGQVVRAAGGVLKDVKHSVEGANNLGRQVAKSVEDIAGAGKALGAQVGGQLTNVGKKIVKKIVKAAGDEDHLLNSAANVKNQVAGAVGESTKFAAKAAKRIAEGVKTTVQAIEANHLVQAQKLAKGIRELAKGVNRGADAVHAAVSQRIEKDVLAKAEPKPL